MYINFILPPLLAGLTGWACGALVNYLADSLPVRRRLVHPFCSSCQSEVAWWNYLFWPRKCESCGHQRNRRSWVVELFYVVVVVWMWFNIPQGWNIIASLVLMVYFGLVTIIDVEHRLILHSVSLAGGLLGLIIGTWQHGLWRTLAGGAVGFVTMLGLYWLGILFIRFQKRRQGIQEPEDALGFGDVNLSGVIGLLLGWPGIIVGLVFAILLAGGFSLVYLVIKLLRREYRPSLVIPYGPFLVASAAWLLVFRGILG